MPWNLADLESYLYERLREYDVSKAKFSNPLGNYACYFEFNQLKTPELNACEVCAVAAMVLADWDGQKNSFQDNEKPSNSLDEIDKYWIPGGYARENLETMEDLFLCTLFSIYVNLILPQDSEDKA